MLRNEIRYTNAKDGVPADLDLESGKLGPPSLFGAAEYAKDGLLAITELLGRTPWFYRMADMTADLMKHAPVASDFGPLPDPGAELNGDVLQTLVRLAPMTGDRRFLEWAERIGDAYVREVLPGNHGLPGYTWDFAKHEGPDRMRLRDHGNEIVVGLMLLHALETERGGDARLVLPRAARPHARPHPGLGQPGRPALRRDPRLRPRAASSASPTTGATSTAPSTPTSWSPARSATARRCGACCGTCRATGATTGRTAATTATPTRSRAPSTSWPASRCRRPSTGSRARPRG